MRSSTKTSTKNGTALLNQLRSSIINPLSPPGITVAAERSLGTSNNNPPPPNCPRIRKTQKKTVYILKERLLKQKIANSVIERDNMLMQRKLLEKADKFFDVFLNKFGHYA